MSAITLLTAEAAAAAEAVVAAGAVVEEAASVVALCPGHGGLGSLPHGSGYAAYWPLMAR